MPVSSDCLDLIATGRVSTELELAQGAGLLSRNSCFLSVADSDALPSIEDNKGRFVYLEDIETYRYSNGFAWTNNYDTTSAELYRALYMWGCQTCGISSALNPFDGNLGINDISISTTSSPVREASNSTNWHQVNLNCGTVHAIKTDGTLWGWGCNNRSPFAPAGWLGDNCCLNRSSPVQEASSATNWYNISGARRVTLATKTDGTLWGWGCNGYNVIGAPTNICFSSPVQEATSATNWCYVDGGGYMSAALKTDGTLWVIGRTRDGVGAQNLSGYVITSSHIQEFTSATNWCKLSLNSNAALIAVKTNGTVFFAGCDCCGHSAANTIICHSSPVQEITSATDWSDAKMGNDFSLLLKNNGELYGSGSNSAFQAGNGGIRSSSPVQEMSSSTDWCFITTGLTLGTGIKTNNTLWFWGAGAANNLSLCNPSIGPTQEYNSFTDWCYVDLDQLPVGGGIRLITKGFNEP